MPARARIWHVCNSLDYAGTGRALETWCLSLDRRRFRVSAFARLEGGPRLSSLRRVGVDARVLGPDAATWAAEFERNACDILHVHRHGANEPGWDQVIRVARRHGVKAVVETNVFGARDTGGEGARMDHHFFVSAMCLWRYAGWPGHLPAGFESRHSVLYNPLRREDFVGFPAGPAQRVKARRYFGLAKDAFVVGRLGRPDPNKWPGWLTGAFARFAERRPEARLLLMEAPAGVDDQCRRLGISDKVLQVPASSDWGQVRRFYQAIDCLGHGSRVGESFGYTLAEAQAAGLPVVVDSTPWADNAQVELVQHGISGLVAGRPAAFAAALEALASSPALARRLGASARRQAWARFDAGRLAAELGRRYESILKARRRPLPAWVLGFGQEYRLRLASRSDPKPWSDRIWAWRQALRLHGRGWASRALKFWRWGR